MQRRGFFRSLVAAIAALVWPRGVAARPDLSSCGDGPIRFAPCSVTRVGPDDMAPCAEITGIRVVWGADSRELVIRNSSS
jgi:hypothetical protein